MDKIALRVVGGPHDGAVYDVTKYAEVAQIGFRADQDNDGLTAIHTAVYRRRRITCEDGKHVDFLCYSEFTDRQALCWLLKIPYEE